MGTDVLKSYDSLQQELEKAKDNLKGLNDNIRRIIGRDPQDTHLRGDRKRSFNDSRRNNDFSNNSDRQKNKESSPTPNKRRQQETKSVFSRLSGPPSRDDEQKPKIHSRVIRELPSRQEIVAAQGSDAESRARNRRMFGCLLGTLQKFCQEESRLKVKEDMKAQIEKKLEEQEIKEKENLKKERQTLFSDRKRQQLEIRKLELKMTRLREFEIWEKTKKDLFNFIKTKSKPNIYFKPKIKSDKTQKLLSECRANLLNEIEKKRSALNDEIQIIENRFKIQEDKLLFKDDNNLDTNTKHNRRNNNYNDDDDEHDSIYNVNSDDEDYQNDRLQSKTFIPKNANDDHKNDENHNKNIKKENNSDENNTIANDENSFDSEKDIKLE